MPRTVFRWLAGCVGLLLATIPVFAHHNISGKFDPARTRTLNGIVTRLDWANPHVHILMDVVEGNAVTNWAVELESTIDLERSGWDLNTLKPGDAVTIQGMLRSAQLTQPAELSKWWGPRGFELPAAELEPALA